MTTPGFISMTSGSAEDHRRISELSRLHKERHYADFLLEMLKSLGRDDLGYPVDRFEHSLQSATRALRDGADEETVVCALLHDVGDVFAPDNHAAAAAALLRPYIGDENYWVIAHHTIFQGFYYFDKLGKDPNVRDAFSGHRHYDACVRFCRDWDECAFDPAYDTLPLATFEPMVRRVLARKPAYQYLPRPDLV